MPARNSCPLTQGAIIGDYVASDYVARTSAS